MDLSRPQVFIFVGRSGCGKGTQAKLLLEKLKAPSAPPALYWEAGVAFRRFISQENFSSRLSAKVMEAGGLQPSFLAIAHWTDFLIRQFTGGEHLVVDGSPRTILEAQALHGALEFYQRLPAAVIYLNVSEEWALARLRGRGRRDDQSEENIRQRLKWFESEVRPSVDFYQKSPDYRFLDINGEQPIPEVHAAILRAL